MTAPDSTDSWQGFRPTAIRLGNQETAQDRRIERAKAQRAGSEEKALELIQGLGSETQGWIQGTPGLTIPDALVDRLIAQIDDTLEGDARRWATNFLARGLERGRTTLGWTVKVPPRIVRLRAPSPPLNTRNMDQLRAAKALRSGLLDELARPPDPGSSDGAFIVLLSAIYFSGLLDPAEIEDFAQAAAQGLRLRGDLAWVDWEDGHAVWHRVFLDPITLTLLLRWRLAHAADPKNPSASLATWAPGGRVWADPTMVRSRALLERAGVSLGSSKDVKTAWGRWAGLIAPASTWWSLYLPGFLLEWSRGRLASTVLPPRVWERIVADRPLAAVLADNQLDDGGPDAARPPDGRGDAWWTRLRAALKKSKRAYSRPVVRSNLARLADAAHPGSLPAELCAWMVHAIEPKVRDGQGLGVTSAYLYLSTVDRRLHAAFGMQPDWTIDAQSLDAIMMQVAQDIPAGSRDDAAHALTSLRLFLEKKRGVAKPDVDFSEGAVARVDANLLSAAEMERLKQVLLGARRQRSWIAACLACHGRLRRSELLGLRLADLVGNAHLTLFVRARAPTKLKTPSAMRQIELHALVASDDRRMLEQYREEVARAAARGRLEPEKVYLFPTDKSLLQPAREKDLIDPIVSAMVRLTGDVRLRFHHLRHTGVNRLVLASMGHVGPGVLNHPAIDTPQDLGLDSAAAVASMVGRARPQRSRLWGVAVSTGHATPQTTLGSYTHVSDWLRHHAAMRCLPHVADTTLGALCGVTDNHIRVLRKRDPNGTQLAPVHLQKRMRKALPAQVGDGGSVKLESATTSQALHAISHAIAPEDTGIWPRLGLVKAAMPEKEGSKAGREQWVASPALLMALGLEESVVRLWLDRACHLLQKSPATRRSSRKSMDLTNAMRLASFPVPGVPRGRIERMQSLEILDALQAWQAADPDSVERWLVGYLMQRDGDSHVVHLKEPIQSASWIRECMELIAQANLGLPDQAAHLRVRVQHTASRRAIATAQTQLTAWRSVVPHSCIWNVQGPRPDRTHSRGSHGVLEFWIEPLGPSPRSKNATCVAKRDIPWNRRAGTALTIATFCLLVFGTN